MRALTIPPTSRRIPSGGFNPPTGRRFDRQGPVRCPVCGLNLSTAHVAMEHVRRMHFDLDREARTNAQLEIYRVAQHIIGAGGRT